MRAKWTKKWTAMLMALAMTAGTFAGGAVPQKAATVSAATGITASKAKRIAMKNAGTSSSKVYAMDYTKTYKNGKNLYMVYFYTKTGSRRYTHYAYTISSRTGDIIKKNSKAYTVITAKRAKNIAIDDAGYDRDDVDSLEADFDEEDGKLVYNVSFEVSKTKTRTNYYGTGTESYTEDYDYEYTINAVTENIIDSDEDDDDD